MANRRTAELSRYESTASSPAPSSSASAAGSKASSPTEQQNQTDYQFLNFSHPSEAKDSRARKTVRSHVTKQQHQREHAAAAARRAKSFPQPEDQRDSEIAPISRGHAATFPSNRPTLDSPASSRQVTGSPEASSQAPSASNSPTEQRSDYFHHYPSQWHPYIDVVVEHYFSTMALCIPNLDGVDARGLLRSRFLPLALSNLATQHALVLIAASHYGNAKGSRSHTINLVELHEMAFKEVTEGMQNASRAITDQMIAAVSLMATYEALFGDKNTSATHMKGLHQMVAIRLSKSALGLDGLLERILLWIDSNVSHILGSKLSLDRGTLPSNVNHPVPDPDRFSGRSLRRSP